MKTIFDLELIDWDVDTREAIDHEQGCIEVSRSGTAAELLPYAERLVEFLRAKAADDDYEVKCSRCGERRPVEQDICNMCAVGMTPQTPSARAPGVV